MLDILISAYMCKMGSVSITRWRRAAKQYFLITIRETDQNSQCKKLLRLSKRKISAFCVGLSWFSALCVRYMFARLGWPRPAKSLSSFFYSFTTTYNISVELCVLLALNLIADITVYCSLNTGRSSSFVISFGISYYSCDAAGWAHSIGSWTRYFSRQFPSFVN